MKKQIKLTAVVLLSLTTISSVYAEDVTKDSWHISPYFWLPSMDVTSTLGLTSIPIEMDFGDIWENFDVIAISARGEYWVGQYGFVVDGLWMDMQADGGGPGGNAEAQLSDGILDILAAYRFNLKSGGPDVPSMRLLAGGRYHYFKQELSGLPTPPAPASNLGGSRDWMELVLGAQLLAPMGEKWLATARADVGGFGISDASDITWSAMAGVGWEFARDWLVKLGYRYYYIDYMDGSGANAFGIEGNMHGPWIGISYGR